MHHYPPLATSNAHKAREFEQILGSPIKRVDIDLDEIQSVGLEPIIAHKAQEAYRKLGEPVLVEDTGLFIEAWNGLPGGQIKWFMESVGNQGILDMMHLFTNRTARAITLIGMYTGTELLVAKGETMGSIATMLMGESSFGWDPIFIPEGHTKSFAQMSQEEKNTCSMRRRALEHLKEILD